VTDFISSFNFFFCNAGGGRLQILETILIRQKIRGQVEVQNDAIKVVDLYCWL